MTAAKRKEEDKFMNEQTKPEANPDDLTKTTETGSIDLTEQELDRVSGAWIEISSATLDEQHK